MSERARLDAEVKAAAGCVTLRRTRRGRLVGLYRSLEAGIEKDPETPWATVCEEHGGVCHATLADARAYLSHPDEWCPGCQQVAAEAS